LNRLTSNDELITGMGLGAIQAVWLNKNNRWKYGWIKL